MHIQLIGDKNIPNDTLMPLGSGLDAEQQLEQQAEASKYHSSSPLLTGLDHAWGDVAIYDDVNWVTKSVGSSPQGQTTCG